MPGKTKRILILTADAGLGHRRASEAMSAALRETHGAECRVDIVNPLDDERAPALLRDSQADYDQLVTRIPGLYRFGYRASDAALPTAVIEQALTVILYDVMRRIVRRYAPDVIVATYPIFLPAAGAVFAVQERGVPLITVVTDLATVHRLWFQDATDLCLVPTLTTYDMALAAGLPSEKVRITGIPVDPALARSEGRAALRARLGWHPDLTTVLAVGGKRVSGLGETLAVLNHCGWPLQLVVVAGGDDELYLQLQETEWHPVTHTYNFVRNMPEMLHAADCILCKAGGLIVTEALACGLPILLFDVIQGQETGNVEYVVEGGAGELAEDPFEVLETMCHWLEHGGELLRVRADNARRLGRPRAAYDAADLIWEAAQRSSALVRPDRVRRRPGLIDLLEAFQIPWREEGRAQEEKAG